jgi:hypothetical protein
VVVGHVRPAVGLDDAEVCEQQRDGFAAHRATAVGMQRELAGRDAIFRARLGDESFGERRALLRRDHPADHDLQRLDGPVRGNGQIIQELESVFRGAGWHVVKAIWGSDRDALLANDTEGLLAKRMGEVVDGE